MNDIQVLDIGAMGKADSRILVQYIQDKFKNSSDTIKILEAGCGRRWYLDIQKFNYELTGLDISQEALEIRRTQKNDLDKTILGDLRTIELEKSSYDVIYSSYVLEHIDGAEKILDKFLDWLKPNGMLILRIPDGDTVKGFFTKHLPFWVHLFYCKYIQGSPNAGKPGYEPFPTPFDPIISRKAMHQYCQQRNLQIKMEHSYLFTAKQRFKALPMVGNMIVKTAELLSLGKLASNRVDLLLVIEKTV